MKKTLVLSLAVLLGASIATTSFAQGKPAANKASQARAASKPKAAPAEAKSSSHDMHGSHGMSH
jgi:hypothetical protein